MNQNNLCQYCGKWEKFDGNHCQKCRNAKSLKNYYDNIERVRKYQLDYYQKNRSKLIKVANSNNKKNLLKYRARQKVRDFVRLGRIKKSPCEVCGEVKVQGHHKDYLKPLEVNWLCIKHHYERHKKYATA